MGRVYGRPSTRDEGKLLFSHWFEEKAPEDWHLFQGIMRGKYELDGLLVCSQGIFVMEIKHWAGRVSGGDLGYWMHNGMKQTNPLQEASSKTLATKNWLLSMLDLQGVKVKSDLRVQAIVLVTHPDIELDVKRSLDKQGRPLINTMVHGPLKLDQLVDYILKLKTAAAEQKELMATLKSLLASSEARLEPQPAAERNGSEERGYIKASSKNRARRRLARDMLIGLAAALLTSLALYAIVWWLSALAERVGNAPQTAARRAGPEPRGLKRLEQPAQQTPHSRREETIGKRQGDSPAAAGKRRPRAKPVASWPYRDFAGPYLIELLAMEREAGRLTAKLLIVLPQHKFDEYKREGESIENWGWWVGVDGERTAFVTSRGFRASLANVRGAGIILEERVLRPSDWALVPDRPQRVDIVLEPAPPEGSIGTLSVTICGLVLNQRVADYTGPFWISWQGIDPEGLTSSEALGEAETAEQAKARKRRLERRVAARQN